MNRCEQELCRNWSGDGNVCPCAVFGIEPDVVEEGGSNCPPTCPDGCWTHQDIDRDSRDLMWTSGDDSEDDHV